VRGRWKVIKVEGDHNGYGKIGKEAWHTELEVAQEQGLTGHKFLIVGEENEVGPTQGVGQEVPPNSALAGIMDKPEGARTINYEQFRVIMGEAKRTNTSRTRMADRPKGWT
jgi:hypothetical protein